MIGFKKDLFKYPKPPILMITAIICKAVAFVLPKALYYCVGQLLKLGLSWLKKKIFKKPESKSVVVNGPVHIHIHLDGGTKNYNYS